MKYSLRMTKIQHRLMQNHLFPGDGKEAVALLLCGRRNGLDRHVFTVRKVVPVAHDACDRYGDRITWPTETVESLLSEAYGKSQAILKVHSHPVEYRRFSEADDRSDAELFASITGYLGDGFPHASLVMLPGGELFGRVLGEDGKVMGGLDLIMVIGDDLTIWNSSVKPESIGGFAMRHAQAFGQGTTSLLRQLTIAIVGCSGTGSIVAEQLARLGVGRLLLVDPDAIEIKNLNRILNSSMEDAYLAVPKAHALAKAIARMGLNQEVLPLVSNLISTDAVRRVAECDIVFGCMDGAEGRHMLNRLATFYSMPYFDVGVRLDADGHGGIDSVSGAVHYIQPGLSSLLSRGAYDLKRVEAEEIRRTDAELYRRRVKEGYLRGVGEDRPAVISVNMFFASLAVTELLARLHPFRNAGNGQFAYLGGSLSEMQFYPESETDPCSVLQRHVGRGDVLPLLERPTLS